EKSKDKAKRDLTGREIIIKKFADKFYQEEDTGDKGTEIDMSAFRDAIEEVEEENIKDYGDGKNAFFEENNAT
ncbi:hypothetical protein WICPIJ_000849, partial [Wickerhamomyces pijperi]